MASCSRRTWLAAILTACASGLRAQRTPPPEAATLPGARLRGEGRLRFFGLHVYDARLWVTDGFAPAQWQRSPLLLELEYARTLYGRLIAERSVTEMRRQQAIDDTQAERWQARMTELFPDVAGGDRISALHDPAGRTRVFFNGGARGDVADAAFTRLFFGIWLAPETSEPRLREQLLRP